MNYELLKGNWNVVKDRLKVRWSKLTDDDLKRVEGSHEELGSVLQQRYRLSRDKAEADGKAFFVGIGAKAEPLASASGTNGAKPTTSAS